ncbi:hypothetical protein LTR12_007473 [Friedmanniomyces endolithicus]|nr:hypothetical protein LTR12_007473 [Friedmanniomyces endolithicus]
MSAGGLNALSPMDSQAATLFGSDLVQSPHQRAFIGEDCDPTIDPDAEGLSDAGQYSPRPQGGAPYFHYPPPVAFQIPTLSPDYTDVTGPVFGGMTPLTAAEMLQIQLNVLPAEYTHAGHSMPPPARRRRQQTGGGHTQPVLDISPGHPSASTGSLPAPMFVASGSQSGFTCFEDECLFTVPPFCTAQELAYHEEGHYQSNAARESQGLQSLPAVRSPTMPLISAPSTPTATSALTTPAGIVTSSPGDRNPSTEPLSQTDTNDPTLLELASHFPIDMRKVFTDGVVVWYYYCFVDDCERADAEDAFDDERELRCKKRSNLFGKGRHVETQHPGADGPTQKVEEVQPGLGTPAPAKPSPGSAMSPPPRILQTPTTTASMALSPPHTFSVAPRPLALPLPAERHQDTGRVRPDLRQMRQPTYGGAHASSSSSSSSRRTRVATPPSRYTSSSYVGALRLAGLSMGQ